jgi:exopolysaccharide biosynthesis protein
LLPLVNAQSKKPKLRLKEFNHQKIEKGLHWYHLQSTDIFDGPQSLNLLKINTNKRTIDLLYTPDTLITTSEYAESVQATAAVNAGFFNIQQGGSVTYIKKDGSILAQNQADLKARNSVVIRGAIVIKTDGKILITAAKETTSYSNDPSIDDVILSGPLLIEDGQPVSLDSTSFTLLRHPRTCACLTAKNTLLLLTADGRHQEAYGLSLPELTQLLLGLKCKNAINLDGGGSTTMYLQWQNENGIVNFPSDNRTFDHYGQRKVANVIVVY